MFGYTGDTLAVFLAFVTLGVPFLWDGYKERGVRRYIASAIGVLLVGFGVFWRQVAGQWPDFAGQIHALLFSLQTWAYVVAVALGAFLLSSPILRPKRKSAFEETEAAFRRRMDAHIEGNKNGLEAVWQKLNELAAVQRTGTPLPEDRGSPKIGIVFEPQAPYETSTMKNGRMQSTVKLGIRNLGGGHLSNIKLSIEDVSPPISPVGGFPIGLLDGGFSLRQDDPEKLVEIASHWNHVDQWRFNAPHGHWAESLNYFKDGEEHTISVRVHATEMDRRAVYKLWADDAKKLHLKYIGDGE